MTAPLRAGEPTTVRVALGARSYDIVIGRGILASLGHRVAALKPGAKAAIVTDTTVERLLLDATRSALAAGGIAARGAVPLRGLERRCSCVDALIAADERGDCRRAGGGVVATSPALCRRRGRGLDQVPTSLLAQVDSSVGGKTAINSRHGKNLIGAFHQPILVVADTQLLDTLPEREFRAGYAEVAKYGLLGDAGFFAWLEANADDVFAGRAAAREHAIATSCRMKAEIVARDERETGDRALLNLGHTFGHAFEAAAGFSERLLHGEAVALGMSLAFEFSAARRLLSPAEAERVTRHLGRARLPTRIAEVTGGVPMWNRCSLPWPRTRK
jgi:3-dehydroquinate synthetase